MTITLDAVKPFMVTSGKYKFRFIPEQEGGFSVSCTNVRGINAQGETFEEALRDALSAAAFVEQCVADIEAEKKARKHRTTGHPKSKRGDGG